MTARSWLAICVACASWPASAILIRSDREDAEYLELASHYPSTTAVAAAGGEAVLIASSWAITTSGNAAALAARKDATLSFGGRAYAIAKTFPHPDARAGTGTDVALVQLAAAVRGVEPTPIEAAPVGEGQVVILVGHGATGHIGGLARDRDGKKRAGINTIDRLEPATLALRVKPPEEASDLQGATAPGDEGAPAFARRPEGPRLVGLHVANDGDWNVFVRLSAVREWVQATMLAAEREAADKLLGDRGG